MIIHLKTDFNHQSNGFLTCISECSQCEGKVALLSVLTIYLETQSVCFSMDVSLHAMKEILNKCDCSEQEVDNYTYVNNFDIINISTY